MGHLSNSWDPLMKRLSSDAKTESRMQVYSKPELTEVGEMKVIVQGNRANDAEATYNS